MARVQVSIVPPTKDENEKKASKITPQKAIESLREVFEHFDADKDGLISFFDLKNTLLFLCEYETDHGVEEMMRKILLSNVNKNDRNIQAANIDVRTQFINFESFAQSFLYYYLNEESVINNEELLLTLTNSPTATSVSLSYFSTPNQVLLSSEKSSKSIGRAQKMSELKETRRSDSPSLRPHQMRIESLTSAYEISELISEKKFEKQVNISDDEEMLEEEHMIEQITLDEFENRQAFRVLDFDGNGSVTIGELKDLIIRYCPGDVSDELDEDRLIDMLGIVDINSDGQIQYNEFIKIIKTIES